LNPVPLETSPASSDSVVRHLEHELEKVKSRLRDTVEQAEASTEELKASNEELQSMNEELRSATEELETSREELQSINEELTTVNQEMKVKMDEIAHANSDLQNLMASTSIATVFLDRDLDITRYTPTAVDLFHLIPGDLGRPLAHLKHQLDYPGLMADAEQVLRTLVPVEREVRGDGEWYLARLQPYRTVEDHIAGLVLTFVNITDRRQATESLRDQLLELERFNIAAVGRESRMVDLKKEINELCTRMGDTPRYSLDLEPEEGDTQKT
jgi:two-component system CheB/CheR fusion protein